MLTAVERLINWSGLGWRHIVIFAFLYTVPFAMSSVELGLADRFSHVFGLFENSYDDIDSYSEWILCYGPILTIPLVISTGFLQMWVGRYTVLMGALIILILLSPLAYMAVNTEMWVAIQIISRTLYPILTGPVLIYMYEATPVKYRRISVLSLGIFVSLGRLAFAISERYNFLGIADTLWQKMLIASFAPVIIPIIIGLFVLRDSSVSLVDRGAEDGVYDDLTKGRGNDAPISKQDFVNQVASERDTQFSNLSSAVIKKWPTFVFLLLTCQNYQIVESIIYSPYYYLFLDYCGGGYDEFRINGLVIINFASIAGILMGIFIVLRFKSIKVLPGISAIFIAIGAALCSTVQSFKPNGYPHVYEDLNMPMISAGIIISMFGSMLAIYVQNLMTVELVPSKFRPVFVMALLAMREIWQAMTFAVYNKFMQSQALYIVTSVVLGIIAIVHFVVLCGTKSVSTRDLSEESVNGIILYYDPDKVITESEEEVF